MDMPIVSAGDTCYMDKVFKVHTECKCSWYIIISPAVLIYCFPHSHSNSPNHDLCKGSVFLFSLPSLFLWERNFFTNQEIELTNYNISKTEGSL